MTEFSAKEPALGYMYQARYALWRLLDGPEDQELILETLDDIVLESAGNLAALVQTKHHIKPATLTDLSTDLWKTIRVWSEHLGNSEISIPPTTLFLVTTGTAGDDSIASKLRPGRDRDTSAIVASLLKAANESDNKQLKSAFKAFAALNQDQQAKLVGAISIIENSPNMAEVREKIYGKIRIAVDRDYRNAVLERLEGWWFDRVAEQFMSKNVPTPATGYEINDKVRNIADQFGPNALPIDFLDAKPEKVDANADDRTFVKQLRFIDVGVTRIEKAILDYYRAFEQRSRWAREELLIGDEIEKYEALLIDEWERFAELVTEDLGSESEEVLRQAGKKIFNWMEQSADFKIRPDVAALYVMRGSYHILANATPSPRVWWHPKFMERISAVLASNA